MSFFMMELSAQSSTNPLLQKSEEAFNTQRWKSAGTLYELLLKDSVNYTPYMAKALLANELAADEVSLRRADALFGVNRFRMDSLLSDFSKLCIRLRHFDVFEESLDRTRKVMPENSDTLLYGMIKYRLFLRDSKGAIRIAREGQMEQPDNLLWLRLEAEGWQLAGRSDQALLVYRKLLARDPDNLDALLYEGNYYYLTGKEKISRLEKEFEQQSAGSRMQYAAYRERVQEVLDNEFAQAIQYLEKANEIKQNTTIAHTLYDMYVLKSEVDKANKLKKRL
ncbi:MAG: hypothetical protein RR212_03640 [Bacteroidales bacterium]